MAHLQYMPGDPRLVDQLVYELKSKGIFDQFRKECIADVDTRPAYQNLRQRVESSVSTFLSHQCWKPDLNKNQLREKLRKHILDGNYLEQGVERIVDQVVNPKVASVFIPQVEDLVYNYLGITRKKSTPTAETSNEKTDENDLLPTDLEAVSPGSVKSNDEKEEPMDIVEEKTNEDTKMEIDHVEKPKEEEKKDNLEIIILDKEKSDCQDTQLSGISDLTSRESDGSMDKSNIPLPAEEIKPENIPPPENSPPKAEKVELEKIELPREPNLSTDIPLPDEIVSGDKDNSFKPISLNSDDDESSSDSSLRRNMSPLTPIRNFNNENSCDAMQGFENDSGDSKSNDIKETTNTFKFTIETKSRENSCDATKLEKKDVEQSTLSYQFNNQVNINTFNTPMYDDSSNSNNLQIDYESDINSKTNIDAKLPEVDQNSEDVKKEEDSKKEKTEEKKSSHKSSHRSRDSHRHSSSSKDKRSDSKHSSSRDRKDPKYESKSSKDDKKKDEHKTKSSNRERSKDRGDKKDSRDSSKHRSSSHKSSKNKDSKSDSKSESKHKSSGSSKHSSKHDDKKSSSSNNKDKEKSSEKNKEHKYSRESSRDSKSHRSDKDKKSSSKKHDEKDKERKEKKETDDHYSASGRGNHSRRSTDRDSNDGSSSSKGSNNQSNLKSSESKKDNKSSSSKSDNTSTNSDSRSPTDKEQVIVSETEITKNALQFKPIVRVDTHLETPISAPPRLPFVPDVTLKKPRFAANLEEAKKMMKMRKFLEEEQRRMNQEAALLLEFQANVRPSLSQVYSNIPGPELEFACVTNTVENSVQMVIDASQHIEAQEKHNKIESIEIQSNDIIEEQSTVNMVNGVDNDDDRETTTNTIEIKSQVEELSHQVCGNEVVENHSNPECLDTTCNENEMDIQKTNTDKTSNECIKATNEDEENNEDDEENRNRTKFYEITIITEIVSESEADEKDNNVDINKEILNTLSQELPDEKPLEYFSEHEKYNAELERDKFSKFLKTFTDSLSETKLYLINCDTHGENLMREIAATFGQFQIVNYYKNGHIKLRTPRQIVSNVNLANEISLPLEKSTTNNESALNSLYNSPVFSPVKSECSFDLSNDYDAKLQEMVSKTSRKEIMEIILGDVEESCIKMPKIDYCTESNIEIYSDSSLKRKLEVDSLDNNNKRVLSPNKIRKLSESDQISSTTGESKSSNMKMANTNATRSKYLGKARRVGLSKPKKAAILPNSPSSDKSVENYEQTNTQPPNGKIKTPQKSKVQRQVYDKSDLYKPKLHYLSRRNNIT